MINVVRMPLDLSKPPESEGRVVVRQGESLATTLVVEVSLDGDPIDLSGWEAFACFRLPGGTYVEDGAIAENSTVTYVMSAATCQTPGLSRECCIALRKGGSCVTTGSFSLLVLPDPCEGDGGVAQAYVSRVEELMGRFRDEFNEAEALREQRVSAAVTEASDAASRANDAADLVHQAIQGDLEPLFGEYLADLSMTPEEVGTIWSGSGAVDQGKLLETPGTEALVELVHSMPDNQTLEYSGAGVKALRVKDGAVTVDKLADGAVTSEKIAHGAITSDKLSAGAVEGKVHDAFLLENELWSGSWSRDSITVEGVSDYSLLIVVTNNRASVLAIYGPFGLGGAMTWVGISRDSPNSSGKVVDCAFTMVGDTLTGVNRQGSFGYGNYPSLSSTGTSMYSSTITKIYGVV